jgi:predicted SAM-dependent methyltransferase
MSSLKSWVQGQTTRGFRRAARQLFDEFRVQRRHLSGRRRAAAIATPEARIQLGCGGNPKPGWINVDLFAAGADIALDLREELPFPSNIASFVYSEHLFEHLEYPGEAKRFVSEVFRVLQPGGTFSIVVPDASKALAAYANPADPYFAENRRLRSYLAAEHPTLMHHVNYTFRADGQHKYAYDEETLGQVLRDAGFADVARREFDPQLDSPKRRGHSLYMQGTKASADRLIG